MEDIRRRKGKANWGKLEGETSHARLWTQKQTEGLEEKRVGRWVSLVMHSMEGMYCMEHWVWCINNEF